MIYLAIILVWFFSPILIRKQFKVIREQALITGKSKPVHGLLFAAMFLPLLVILMTAEQFTLLVEFAIRMIGKALNAFAHALAKLAEWIVEG